MEHSAFLDIVAKENNESEKLGEQGYPHQFRTWSGLAFHLRITGQEMFKLSFR